MLIKQTKTMKFKKFIIFNLMYQPKIIYIYRQNIKIPSSIPIF